MQSQKIPPLLGKQGSCNSSAPLAWSCSSSTTTARNWAGHFPTDCTSTSEYQFVKIEAMGAQLFQLLFVSVLTAHCPSPWAGWQPSSQDSCPLLSGLQTHCPSPTPPLPLWASNQPVKLGLTWRQTKIYLPGLIYFSSSLPPIRNLRIAATNLSSGFGKERDFICSQKHYIFHRFQQAALMIICSSAVAVTANPNIVYLSWKCMGSFMVASVAYSLWRGSSGPCSTIFAPLI